MATILLQLKGRCELQVKNLKPLWTAIKHVGRISENSELQLSMQVEKVICGGCCEEDCLCNKWYEWLWFCSYSAQMQVTPVILYGNCHFWVEFLFVLKFNWKASSTNLSTFDFEISLYWWKWKLINDSLSENENKYIDEVNIELPEWQKWNLKSI